MKILISITVHRPIVLCSIIMVFFMFQINALFSETTMMPVSGAFRTVIFCQQISIVLIVFVYVRFSGTRLLQQHSSLF